MNIADSGNWSGGFIACIIIMAVVALVMTVAIFAAFNLDYPEGAAVVAGGAFITLLIFAGALFPWSGEYHQYREVSGHVAEVSDRMVSTGNAMEQKFVVRFEGSDQEFRVDDTRAALIEPGGELHIKCIKEWSYNATDGYICNWGAYTS